eukprot:Lithocolla_globosa_v1_NODE_236_length_4948_cov_18.708359.p3 type:complete len:118 gc:universal NODE_236_length_4948_cov_18.708359:2045-1692(-)
MVLKRFHFLQSEHRVTDNKSLAVFCRRVRQKVALRTNRTDKAHHNFLSDGVNRRVGDLSKQLLEIIVHLAWLFRQNGEGGIITHTSEGLFTSDAHWQQKHLQLFAAEAKHVQLAVRL